VTLHRLAATAVLAALLLGCGPRGVVQNDEGLAVDGWPVGEKIAECSTGECGADLRVATAALAARDPSHPTVVSVALHEYDHFGPGGVTRSANRVTVAVFRLADGSLRAIGIHHIIDNPPDPRPFGP
jgi:hypothetical protein